MDHFQASANLLSAKEVLDSLSMPFWLTDGTLLGYVRENSLIDHDHDVDLGVFRENYHPDLVPRFIAAGFTLASKYGSLDEGLEYTFVRGDSRLDVFFFYQEVDYMWCSSWLGERRLRYRYPKISFSKIEFQGKVFNIPSNPSEYLAALYGNFWQDPDKAWHWPTSHQNAIEAPWLEGSDWGLKSSYAALARIAMNSIQSLLRQYQSMSGNELALSALRQARKQCVDFWLSIPPEEIKAMYSNFGSMGRIHTVLECSALKYHPLSEAEQAFVTRANQQLSEGIQSEQSVALLLGLMLFQRADQTLLPCDLDQLDRVAPWFIPAYLKYVLTSPGLFQEHGEVRLYYQYLKKWIDYVHARIFQEPESELWNYAAQVFAQRTNLIPVYFTTENLKSLYTKRAEIIEFWLTQAGYSLDYHFPMRDAARSKIRVGILKGHFNPQTETFLTIPAFEHLDRSRFEVILYATYLNQCPLEQYCQSLVDKVVHLPQDLEQQVQMMRADDLDVLLLGTNVTAVTNDICLLVTHRLARVQATLYSSPVTTGMRHIDAYISGNLIEPSQGAQDHYREQLVLLEGTGYCFNYGVEEEASEPKPTRQELGIAEDAVTFISGANFFKIIPELRESWARIIAAVPNSVLLLYPFSPSWSNSYARDAFVKSWHQVFEKYGISNDRIIFLNPIEKRADVKEYLKLSDIYLDSLPYTGSFSVSDALEVGVPPLVVDGATLRSRQAAALLRDFHLPELITQDEDSYIQAAIRLATDSEFRHQKRQQISATMSQNPRFLDSRDYSRQIGNVCEKLFQQRQLELLEQSFRLKRTNLIAFPDWTQPEEVLFQRLADLIRSIATHDERCEMTLLIHAGGFDESEADMAISSVVMYLMTEEGVEIDDDVAIVLVDPDGAQWEMLMPRLSNWVTFTGEEPSSSVNVSALPSCDLDELQGRVFAS
jgi:predicted O-linked N-acetylglucosamine transferase (SPINDLY family)